MTVAAAPRRARLDASLPVLGVLALVLCVLVLLPLGWLLWYGFTDKTGAPTLANFARLATDRSFVGPFLSTIAIALGVATLSCVVATPLAWLVARTDMPGHRLVRLLVMASFVTPPFLGAIAWEILAAPNSGVLNQWYRALLGLDPYAHVFDIYTVEGLTFVMGCYAFPYVFVLVANALERVPAELEDASAILGGGRWHTFRRVSLPIVLPALLAGALIAFLQAMTQFGAPAILALPAGFHVITTKIWSLFQFPPDPHLAAAASLPLLLLTLLLLRGQHWLLKGRGYTVIGGKSGPPRRIALGAWRWPAFLFVLGVGLFLAYTRPPFVLYGTLMILLLAFVTIELPAAYQQLQAALAGLHPELEEASRILGASRLTALRHITAPLLRSSVVATWCFIFIGAIRELSATIMLTTANTKLVSVIIYDLNESGDLGAISVLGISLLVLTFVTVAIANHLPTLGRGGTAP